MSRPAPAPRKAPRVDVNTMVTGQRQRWIIAAAGAAVIVTALMFLFRLPPPPSAWIGLGSTSANAGSATKPAVRLARPSAADQFLQDETELRDLRPLFLPTERNAALPELKREAGRAFLTDEPVKLSFLPTELDIAKDLPPLALVNGKPAQAATPLDALASEDSARSLLGFGRGEVKVRPLQPRGGLIEVVSTATGRPVFAEPIAIAARPPGDTPWAPLEFLARIDAAGLASPLVVTASSGVEEVDAHFRRFLVRTYRIGERLTPGFYRVIVAP